MNTYEIDTRVQVNASFVVYGTDTPIDPTTVNLFLATPAGVVVVYTYPDDVVRVSEGVYYLRAILDASGPWTYKWQGIGAAEVTSADTRMYVNQSVFSPSAT